ncbi:hypothetical protein MKL09_02960 [Methylobacterium sp. J-048]|uniref:hypothetical protein n=1 Tax=Methylobacterium sp. J-048 TaxID=2836635 RepID=UPI001FB90C0C|nr:hypothetical protein [Methylobacterium sp. J-048]MCJ2055508.1 hypothetical protein [Methylobacterium sp. J-048]
MRAYRPEAHADVLRFMTEIFNRLEARLPRPRLTATPSGLYMRYQEQLIEQAIILKLARVLSGLKAVQVLLDNGLSQEQGAIQRMVDEICEDIIFLSASKMQDDFTDLHKRYLQDFWSEEFDNPDPIKSQQVRAMVPRKKIRAYIHRLFPDDNPARGIAASQVLHKAYSGFVHAASPQVMDMYVGSPPRFHVEGMLGTPRMKGYQRDAWNYYYRGLLTIAHAAKALGDEEAFQLVFSYVQRIEAAETH